MLTPDAVTCAAAVAGAPPGDGPGGRGIVRVPNRQPVRRKQRTQVRDAEAHGADYRPGLDGLRAISVSAVLAFHLDRLPGGNLGVDAFFVISGWLITWKLLDEKNRHGSIALRRFWTARARRLMPASVCVLIAVGVAWPLAGIDVPTLRADIVWAALWSSNWGTIRGGGDYWARFGELSPITHFWSLAIEEQFYVVWPLTVVAVTRWRRSRLAVGLTSGALALGSIAVMVIIADPGNPTPAYMNTFARAHTLLIGAAAAAITTRRPVRAARGLVGGRVARRAFPFAAAAAVWLVLASSPSSAWLFRWGFPTFAVAMAIVVVAVADGAAIRVLASPPMRWISERSYGLYLWHWPVFLLLTPTRAGFGGVTLDAVRVLTAVAVSDASYRWVETPIRRGRMLSVRWVPIGAAVAVASVIAVAVMTVPTPTRGEAASVVTLPPAPSSHSGADAGSATPTASDSRSMSVSASVPVPVPDEFAARSRATGSAAGGPTEISRRTPSSTAAPAATQPDTAKPGTTPAGTTPASTTLAGTSSTVAEAVQPILTLPVRVLVAGDSTAQHLAGAMLPFAAQHPNDVVAGSAAFPGCGLTAARDGRRHGFTNQRGEHELIDLSGCIDQWTAMPGRVSGPEQIDVVLIQIGPWDGADIYLPDGRVVSIADPEGYGLVVEAYTSFVQQMREAGAIVVWVTPVDIELQWGAVDDPMNDPARWAKLRAIIDALPVTQIDLAGWLTAAGLDGPLGRPDGVHLTADAADRFVREAVAPALAALATKPA